MYSGKMSMVINIFGDMYMCSNFEISLTFCDLALLNTFQKRRVSSPAPVTIASPSGDTA